jgi:hypothetical protein
MPNGHYGTDEEWKRLEGPLRDIDEPIEAFARRHGMAISRNYHNWPERSLRWDSNPERLIQVYLEDEERLTWNLWLCAGQDRGGQRFWKNQMLRRNVPMSEIRPVIERLLDEALTIVGSWQEEDLSASS